MQKKPCGAYIKHISDVLQRNCNNALQTKGLTMSQLTVLHLLQNAPCCALPLKELEKELRVAQSTAAGIITRMEEKGLVQGYGHAEDKRIKMIRITEAGRACFADAQGHSLESEAQLLSALTEEEKCLLNTLLKKVSESLSETSV